MTKDEALDLALEFIEANHFGGPDAFELITAIKQARALDKKAENARELGLDYEPVAWKWHQAPVKTQWGSGMVVADLAIDKDHTVSVYCERDQTAKVEAMFTPPAAPVQEPVAHLWKHSQTGRTRVVMPGGIITADASWFVVGPLILGSTTPPTQSAPVQDDLADFIAGAFGVSRGTAYDMMREALKEAAPVQEPVAWMDGYRNIYSLEEKAAGCPEATIPLGLIANQLANQRETSGSPVVSELHCICGAEWEWHNRDWELVATPPAAQRQWVGLTDEERGQAINANFGNGLWHMAKDIEAKLKEKNT